MVAPVDIVNQALSEIGSRTLVSSLLEASPAAAQARLQYQPLRQQVLRAAPWGFARKTLSLTSAGLLTDTPPASPFPWLDKYIYPPDCLKMRYILPPPVLPVVEGSAPDVSDGTVWPAPWCGPSRQWRYVISYDDTVSPPRRVVLANILQAIGVYTVDVEDPDLWDPLFRNALVMALASKLVIPLTGNVGMKQSYAQLAEVSLTQARAVDGNESVPTTDHVVDWIATRGVGLGSGWSGLNGSGAFPLWGQYFSGDEPMNWGM